MKKSVFHFVAGVAAVFSYVWFSELIFRDFDKLGPVISQVFNVMRWITVDEAAEARFIYSVNFAKEFDENSDH